MSTATDALGLADDEVALIVTCDDLGFSHGSNLAIYEALREQRATSASVMVPAPWARAAAANFHGEDIGVHLTLNSEFDQYRWGPITHAPSLLDGDGAFPRTIDDVWEHADSVEVHREWQAQIARAELWGFTLTHLNSHLSGVELKPEFFDVYLDLADEHRLAVRLPGPAEERRIGFPFRVLADERGVLAPDRVMLLSTLGSDEEQLRDGIAALEPGITEVRVHPAVDSAELRAATHEWSTRVAEAELLCILSEIVRDTETRPIRRLGFRELTEAMRR